MADNQDNQYAIRKVEQREQLPEIDLLPIISHGGENLDVAVFGPSTYRKNIATMQEPHFHSTQLSNITFNPTTTSESISAAHYDFEHMAKPKIFDSRWLQVGYIVRTQDGVFTNTSETNEASLKQLLNGAEKVNGIYLLDNGIGFAPYDSFKTGVQDVDTFVEGGLARVLEHTPEKIAVKLRKIGSPKHYKRRIDVWGFKTPKKPILRVASLDSYRDIHGGRLGVGGDSWGDGGVGYAFGVLDKSRSDAPKN